MAWGSNYANDISPQPDRSNINRRTRRFPSGSLFETPDEGEGSKWFAPFFTCSDTATCCRVHFCAYYSFGKLWWRLERIRGGKDPLDSSWNCWSDGCSTICCGVCLLNTMCYGIPLVTLLFWKRNQVRKLYKIKGSVIYDIVLPVFCCAPCVLVQLDREIRLREGDMALKYELSEKPQRTADSQAVQLPPPSTEPMRYVSPRVTSENASNYSGEPPLSVQDRPPSRPRLAFLKPYKNRKTDVASPQEENRAEAPVQYAEIAPVLDHESHHEGGYAKKANNGIENSVGKRMLASSNSSLNSQPENLTLETQDLAARVTSVTTATARIPGRPSPAEDNLTDSEARDIATSLRGKRSNMGISGAQQLSYVHDFSDDCPVNKSVLMYYEKEEEKSKKNPSHGGTTNKLATNNPYQQLANSKDTAGGEQSTPSDGTTSFSKPLGNNITPSSSYEELEPQLIASSSAPSKMRLSDQVEASPSPDESGSQTDKRATSL